MQFGTVVHWIASTSEETLLMAAQMRKLVHERYGKLPYSARDLPIVVIVNSEKNVIESRLPTATEVLVANPEVFLAWADRMAEAALRLLRNPAANGR